MRCIVLLIFVVTLSANVPANQSISYQGNLQELGESYSGSVGMKFRLYDQVSGGSQVAPEIEVSSVNVNDGVFQVDLNFGKVFDGQPLFLEIVVGEETLAPRQQIQPVPHAMFSLNSGDDLDRVVAVGEESGEFQSIQAAIDSVADKASLETPFLILIGPGDFHEVITVPSGVNLRGAGRKITRIIGDAVYGLSDPIVASVNVEGDATLSDLTIKAVGNEDLGEEDWPITAAVQISSDGTFPLNVLSLRNVVIGLGSNDIGTEKTPLQRGLIFDNAAARIENSVIKDIPGLRQRISRRGITIKGAASSLSINDLTVALPGSRGQAIVDLGGAFIEADRLDISVANEIHTGEGAVYLSEGSRIVLRNSIVSNPDGYAILGDLKNGRLSIRKSEIGRVRVTRGSVILINSTFSTLRNRPSDLVSVSDSAVNLFESQLSANNIRVRKPLIDGVSDNIAIFCNSCLGMIRQSSIYSEGIAVKKGGTDTGLMLRHTDVERGTLVDFGNLECVAVSREMSFSASGCP